MQLQVWDFHPKHLYMKLAVQLVITCWLHAYIAADIDFLLSAGWMVRSSLVFSQNVLHVLQNRSVPLNSYSWFTTNCHANVTPCTSCTLVRYFTQKCFCINNYTLTSLLFWCSACWTDHPMIHSISFRNENLKRMFHLNGPLDPVSCDIIWPFEFQCIQGSQDLMHLFSLIATLKFLPGLV